MANLLAENHFDFIYTYTNKKHSKPGKNAITKGENGANSVEHMFLICKRVCFGQAKVDEI